MLNVVLSWYKNVGYSNALFMWCTVVLIKHTIFLSLCKPNIFTFLLHLHMDYFRLLANIHDLI